jgi:hypothetical protein
MPSQIFIPHTYHLYFIPQKPQASYFSLYGIKHHSHISQTPLTQLKMRYSSILLAALIACTATAQDTTTTMATKTKAVKNHTASSGTDASATSTMAAMDSSVTGTIGAGGIQGSSTSKADKSKVAQKSGRNSTATDMSMSMSGSMPTGTGAAYGMSAMGSTAVTTAVTSAMGSGTTSSKPAVQTTNAGGRLLASPGGAIVIAGLGVVFAVYM